LFGPSLKNHKLDKIIVLERSKRFNIDLFPEKAARSVVIVAICVMHYGEELAAVG
jgi:hypothetical protein